MNQLEQTIVANARAELASLLHLYESRKAKGQNRETAEEVDEQQGHFHALYALLVFGHQANSGMSEEGMQALRKIEAEHAAALRTLGSAASHIDENHLRELYRSCDGAALIANCNIKLVGQP